MSAAAQLPLFELRPVPSAPSRADEIEARARRFVASRPEAWRLFVRFTFELLRSGRDHHSSDAVLHRIRWYTAIELASGEEFKVNNDFSAVFARWFHGAYPEHDGFYRTRERTSARRAARGRS